MDIVRSSSLPFIPTNDAALQQDISTHSLHGDQALNTHNRAIYVSPESLKRKIKRRILQYRQQNENVYNDRLRKFEKQNELEAFRASFVTKEEEIGKIFLVDRKQPEPSIPEPEEDNTREILKSSSSRRKQRPLLLPPARLPPIYKTKTMTIKSRDFDEEPDIFAFRPSLEDRLYEIEDCRYLRRVPD